MNKIRIILLIGVGLSLLYSLVQTIILRMPGGRSRANARKRMEDAEWLDEKSRDGALVKITGKVLTKDAGERFVSPLSDSRCVALQMRAMVRKGRGPSGELIEQLQIKPFLLEDDVGKTLIDATDAVLDMSPASLPKTADPRKLFTAIGHEEANPKSSRCEETVVEVGSTVTVAGILVTSPEVKIVGDKDNPIVIRAERVRSNVANEP